MIFRILLVLLLLQGCYEPERDCQSFRDGTFTFTAEINGEEKTTTFERHGAIEIDYFEGRADTSSVRWINDCEYIVRKLHPKNRSEEKAIHMKILSTTTDSYTFEYGLVGSAQRSKGTAVKTR